MIESGNLVMLKYDFGKASINLETELDCTKFIGLVLETQKNFYNSFLIGNPPQDRHFVFWLRRGEFSYEPTNTLISVI